MYKYTGDYYNAKGGLFGLAIPLLGKLARGAAGLLTKRKGAVQAIGRFITRPSTAQARTAVALAGAGAGALALRKIRGKRDASMFEDMGMGAGRGFGGGGRRMNTLNPKALSRATRRIKGFKDRAQGALAQLGFKVVRTGTGGGRRTTSRVCR